MSEVARRLAEVRARMDRAAERAGRSPSSVRLLAVSKFQPLAAIREAYAAGQREFGENYAQDLASRAQALADLPALRWHFIGGFQRNKAKLLLPTGCVVQTVASEAHGVALAERARALGRSVVVMVQVNVAGEPQKSGVASDAVADLVARLGALSGLVVEGLMVIPPADDPARARESYRALARLRAELGLRELSMGMSDDFELAIEEGSTLVRVGSAIFGPRPG